MKTDEIENIENPPTDLGDVSETEGIQAPKVDRRRKGANVRTQKQIDAFEKAKAIRDANRKQRMEEKSKQEEEHKKKMEEKIVKKAIAVKKKQIIKEKIIDEAISDDEIPDEIIQKVMKKSAPPAKKSTQAPKDRVVEKVVYVEPPIPQYRFV